MHQPPKILIVDDTPLNVDLLQQALEELGYQCISALNGQAALAQVNAENPDLILLDMMMPVMDGFEVLTRLKADQQTRDVPVVVISALTDMSSVVRGIELGAEDFLPKPFEPVMLRARLHNSLEKKRLRDQEQMYLRGMERELEIGRAMQASFLPAHLPRCAGWEFAAYFQAARQVAGDFYDAFVLPQEKRVGLLIGDVSDKGVGAALYMALFRTLLRAAAQWAQFAGADTSSAPADADRLRACVQLANNYFVTLHGETNMFTTLFFGLLDPETGALVYMNQGHMPPLVLDANGIKTELRGTGKPIGITFGKIHVVRETRLEPGETLLLYSDGITDVQNAAGEFLDEAQLRDVIRSASALAAPALLEKIVTHVHTHRRDAPQFDDMTLFAVRRLGET